MPPGTCASIVTEGVGETQKLIDRFNAISDKFAEPVSDEEMQKLLDEQAKLQDAIDAVQGWELERKLEIAADALRLPPWDAKVATLSGGERRRVALCRLLLSQPDMLLARRADESSRRGVGGLARALSRGIPEHGHRSDPRSLLSRQRRRLDSRARSRLRHTVAGQLFLVARAEGRAPAAGRDGSRRRCASHCSASSSGCAQIPRRARPRARRACSATRSSPRRSFRSATRPTRSTFRPARDSASSWSRSRTCARDSATGC